MGTVKPWDNARERLSRGDSSARWLTADRGEAEPFSYMTQRLPFSHQADCDTMDSPKDVTQMNIVLERVKSERRDTLFRLLQYSLFEESLTDLNEMNEDALFDYPWFDAYFTEPQREAYFIRSQDSKKLLGFAMVREHEDGRHSSGKLSGS